MERRGITIDRQMLSRLSGEFAQDMARLEAVVGRRFGGTRYDVGTPDLTDIWVDPAGGNDARSAMVTRSNVK